MYVTEIEDLFNSLMEFNEKPEFWKPALGAAPRYFVHTEIKGKHYFGMSKFCVLKDITIEEYISEYRYLTDGNNSQKKISRNFKENWTPRANIDEKIRSAFDIWILSFFPNYTITNANFITIKISCPKPIRDKKVTPEKLAEILQLQIEIGKVGEKIAYEFELQRLLSLGITNPKKYVVQVSTENVASGFDISSITKNEERYIEVKSCLSKKNEFFLSENELETLEKLNSKAFLYCVKITDLENEVGSVYNVIQNPIKKFKDENLLKPIAYKVKLK